MWGRKEIESFAEVGGERPQSSTGLLLPPTPPTPPHPLWGKPARVGRNIGRGGFYTKCSRNLLWLQLKQLNVYSLKSLDFKTEDVGQSVGWKKRLGPSYGGFMSPFGKPFVQDIWLLLLHPPLPPNLPSNLTSNGHLPWKRINLSWSFANLIVHTITFSHWIFVNRVKTKKINWKLRKFKFEIMWNLKKELISSKLFTYASLSFSALKGDEKPFLFIFSGRENKSTPCSLF